MGFIFLSSIVEVFSERLGADRSFRDPRTLKEKVNTSNALSFNLASILFQQPTN